MFTKKIIAIGIAIALGSLIGWYLCNQTSTSYKLVEVRHAPEDSALIIPSIALTRQGTSTYVEIMQEGKIINRLVTVGRETPDGMAEITSGLSPKDSVVLEKKSL